MASVKSNGNAIPNGNGHAHHKPQISSQQVIELEHQYGAHNYHPLPVVFDRAKGAKVWDPEGNEYIDMLSAYSAVNQGHCHPRLIATLTAQAQKLTLSSRAFYNSNFGPFAKRITELFGYEMVLPMNTGAEAVETAIKLSRKWAYEKKGVPENEAIVWAVDGCFHGRTVGVISMSTDPESRTGFGPFLPQVGPNYHDPATSSTRTIKFGDIPSLARAFELYSHKTAALIIEPIQGEAGVVVPPEGYLTAVAKLCKDNNVLLVCDEIQSGLCRSGKLLASDWEGIKPDVVLLGKALSGGMYPISAVLSSREIMLVIKPGEHGSTYGGNPLACAIGLTALDILIDENLAEKSLRLGEIFREEVGKLGKKTGVVQLVRGRGLFNAIVIDDERSIAPGKTRRTAWEMCLMLKSRGVLAKTTHGNVIRFAPPLVITEDELRKSIAIIGQCLEDLDNENISIPGDEGEEKGWVDHLTL